jgi:hypothetical protein
MWSVASLTGIFGLLNHGPPFAQIDLKCLSTDTVAMVRKYITPGSVRIFGLPGIDDNFGVRDNGSGQMWSESKRVGSINYWTGEVVLAREHIPKVRFWSELRGLLGIRGATLPNVSCEYEVSDLDIESRAEAGSTRAETLPLVVTDRYRRR